MSINIKFFNGASALVDVTGEYPFTVKPNHSLHTLCVTFPDQPGWMINSINAETLALNLALLAGLEVGLSKSSLTSDKAIFDARKLDD